MTIEDHIEELRAEARNAPTIDERRQIEAELELAIRRTRSRPCRTRRSHRCRAALLRRLLTPFPVRRAGSTGEPGCRRSVAIVLEVKVDRRLHDNRHVDIVFMGGLLQARLGFIVQSDVDVEFGVTLLCPS